MIRVITSDSYSVSQGFYSFFNILSLLEELVFVGAYAWLEITLQTDLDVAYMCRNIWSQSDSRDRAQTWQGENPSGGFARFGTLLHSAKPANDHDWGWAGGRAGGGCNRVLRGNAIIPLTASEWYSCGSPDATTSSGDSPRKVKLQQEGQSCVSV